MTTFRKFEEAVLAALEGSYLTKRYRNGRLERSVPEILWGCFEQVEGGSIGVLKTELGEVTAEAQQGSELWQGDQLVFVAKLSTERGPEYFHYEGDFTSTGESSWCDFHRRKVKPVKVTRTEYKTVKEL